MSIYARDPEGNRKIVLRRLVDKIFADLDRARCDVRTDKGTWHTWEHGGKWYAEFKGDRK